MPSPRRHLWNSSHLHNSDIDHRVHQQLRNFHGPTNSLDHGKDLCVTTGIDEERENVLLVLCGKPMMPSIMGLPQRKETHHEVKKTQQNQPYTRHCRQRARSRSKPSGAYRPSFFILFIFSFFHFTSFSFIFCHVLSFFFLFLFLFLFVWDSNSDFLASISLRFLFTFLIKIVSARLGGNPLPYSL